MFIVSSLHTFYEERSVGNCKSFGQSFGSFLAQRTPVTGVLAAQGANWLKPRTASPPPGLRPTRPSRSCRGYVVMVPASTCPRICLVRAFLSGADHPRYLSEVLSETQIVRGFFEAKICSVNCGGDRGSAVRHLSRIVRRLGRATPKGNPTERLSRIVRTILPTRRNCKGNRHRTGRR